MTSHKLCNWIGHRRSLSALHHNRAVAEMTMIKLCWITIKFCKNRNKSLKKWTKSRRMRSRSISDSLDPIHRLWCMFWVCIATSSINLPRISQLWKTLLLSRGNRLMMPRKFSMSKVRWIKSQTRKWKLSIPNSRKRMSSLKRKSNLRALRKKKRKKSLKNLARRRQNSKQRKRKPKRSLLRKNKRRWKRISDS